MVNRGNAVNENRKQILEAGLRGEEISVKGIVIPGEADKHLKMVSIVLSTDQEVDFIIERDAKGYELFKHLRDSVKVKGFIQEDKPGKWIIKITDYQVLNQNANQG